MKLSELTKISIGKTPSRDNPNYWDIEKNTKNVWVSIADLTACTEKYIGNSKEYISDEGAKLFNSVPKNTLIMSFKLSIGKLAFTKKELRTNEAIAAFIIKNDKIITKEYLYFFLSSLNWDKLAGADEKVKGKTFNKTKLSKLDIFLPPIHQQKIIVEKMDNYFELFDKQISILKIKKKNLQNLKSSILREKLKSNLKLSKNWTTEELNKVAYTAGRIGWKGLTAKEYVDKGPLFLSVHSLNYGEYVDFRDAFNITEERYNESPEIMLKDNDILICKDGAGIGKTGIIKKIDKPTTINGSLLLIRSLGKVIPKYLYYYLISPMFQKIVNEKIDGATTPHLYQRDINFFSITYPSIPLQKKLVEQIEYALQSLNELENNYDEQISEFKLLKSSTLNNLIKKEAI